MSTIFKLPNLGENIQNATIVKLNVKVGDFVKKDTIIAEVEAGKANLEITSDFDGKIVKIFVAENGTINPGDDFIEYEEASSSDTSNNTKEILNHPPKEAEPSTQDSKIQHYDEPKKNVEAHQLVYVTVPNLGENISEATVVKILANISSSIKINDLLFEVETGKATLEITSEYSGVVKEIYVKEGDKVKTGDKLLAIQTEVANTSHLSQTKEIAKPEEKKEAPVAENTPKTIVNEDSKQNLNTNENKEKVDTYNINKNLLVLASPSVRKFAREIGVDISEVKPKEGKRITIEDVKEHAKNILQNIKETKLVSTSIPSTTYYEPLPDFTKWGEIIEENLSNIRRVTAQHLHFAWSQIPHVTQFDKADITDLENFRLSLAKKYPNTKITVTAIIAKVLVLALKKYKQFNSSIDLENNKIIYKNYYNIGIAVDTSKGLVVPVIKNIDKKSILEISDELSQLAQKAREGKLSLDEMQGATFTISNLGGIGGTYFTPIVNYPEVAILGISRSAYEPKYNGTTFEARLMLPFSLSYDHRVIDGADGIRFLRFIIDVIEKPYELLLNL